MRTEPTDLFTETASVRPDIVAVVPSPVVVLRLHSWLRFGALAALFGGLVVGALGPTAAFAIAIVGLVACLTWVPEVEIDANQLRVRRLRGTVTIPVDGIDEIRLRRVPIGRPRPVHRSYRLGRFCTTPLRLRVVHGEESVVQLTVVLWAHWPALVRYVLLNPQVASDSRTRGRLDRYG